MKQLDCPRCLEPFERGDRFCKKCGLRKSRPFSQSRWWSFALLTDLLIILLIAVIREKVLVAENQPMDVAAQTTWMLFGVLGLCLLLPTICLNRVYRALWLNRHGAITSGKVVEHRFLSAPKGQTRQVAIVEFTPDTAHTGTCDVQHWAWMGVLPLKKKVQVRYDPYNPSICAQVGSGIGDLVFYGILCIMFAGLAVLIAVVMLVATPSYAS